MIAPLAVAAIVAGAAWAVRGKASSIVAPSRWRGVRDRKTIALTFDDGPSESTPELLAALAELGVAATFFQCGANVERLPEIARAVSAAGHEIGNHTYSHARLWLRAEEFIESEVARAQQALTAVHGVAPRLFRAPYGVRWPGLGAAQRKHGLEGVMWTGLGLDWKNAAPAVSARVAGKAKAGAIICLHDGRELAICPDIRETIKSVRILVPRLQNAGFGFETVSSILCPTTSPNA